MREKDPNADISALEKQIDDMDRAGTEALPLQGLTPKEIALVEGKE